VAKRGRGRTRIERKELEGGGRGARDTIFGGGSLVNRRARIGTGSRIIKGGALQGEGEMGQGGRPVGKSCTGGERKNQWVGKGGGGVSAQTYRISRIENAEVRKGYL